MLSPNAAGRRPQPVGNLLLVLVLVGCNGSTEPAFDTLAIATQVLPDGVLQQAYSQELAATGGDGTYVWTISGEQLPLGLNLSSSGEISGTPLGPGGTFAVGVVSGDGQTASTSLTLTIAPLYLKMPTVLDGDVSNNVAPFGGTSDEQYQQVYEAGALGEGGRIRSLMFLSPGQPDIPLTDGNYLIRLETTQIPVMGLSDVLGENRGPGMVTVFDQRIEGLAYGDTLAFELETPFYLDPAEGNLLMDVVRSDAVDPALGAVRVFEAIRNSAVVSRRPAWGGVGDGFGLVTIFVIDSVGVSPP